MLQRRKERAKTISELKSISICEGGKSGRTRNVKKNNQLMECFLVMGEKIPFKGY